MVAGIVRAEDRKLLHQVRLFPHATPATEAWLARTATVVTLPRNTELWKAGQPIRTVFGVLTGRVALLTGTVKRPTIVDIVRPGIVLGVGGAVSDIPAVFANRTLVDSRVLTIPLAAFRRRMQSDRGLVLSIAAILMRRWYALATHVLELKELSANQRLASYLLELTEKQSDTARVRLPYDQLVLASLLGVTRESLSRGFAQLRAHGVSKQSRDVVIADVVRLRRFCKPKK